MLDYSDAGSDEEPEPESEKNKKIAEQKKIWSKGGWREDPYTRHHRAPHLYMESYEIKGELAYFLHFMPMTYLHDTIIPATNATARASISEWEEVNIEQMLQVFGMLLGMGMFRLPERHMYWHEERNGIFPAMEYGKIMSRKRFEDIIKWLQLSSSPDADQQILDYIAAVNTNTKKAFAAGTYVVLDESMIKSFHRNLKGKMKIIRKPRPIGNEIKNMSDGATNIATVLELYEGREIMSQKEWVKEYGATTATVLRLTQDLHSTGRIVVADSWFGSVKSAIALRKRGLYCNMLVKTAHKVYPRELLGETPLARGEWSACIAEIEGEQLQAVRFKDLQVKDFITTCGSILPGNPRQTKYHGAIARPQVAEMYLHNAASIDVHNHVRTGSAGLEDIWQTKSPHRRQFAGE